jgi:transcription termination factor Rho
MHLQELKAKSPADLLAYAEELEIENASTLRKQDMMFAILKQLADNEVAIYGSGVLEVLSDGFGFLRAPESNYFARSLMIFMSRQVRYAGSAFALVTRLKVKFAPPRMASVILPC